ncbi:MAG: hypothetical protein RMJ60_05585 [Anaerolineales bacterium]|nr:hypothetical protein [Anaerolineales bacterium]
MKTPAGFDCKYFYGDYFRGRNLEECRLLGAAWEPRLCRVCPVPSIDRANACPSMRLQATVVRPLTAAFQKRVRVTTFCEKTSRTGFDPYTGCGDCHSLPSLFTLKD